MSATVSIGTLEGLLRWKTDSTEIEKSLNETAKKADISRTQLNAYNREVDSVSKTYQRVAASIDPAIAAQQKLEKSQIALSNAQKAGLIDQEKYNDLLDKAKTKYAQASISVEAYGKAIAKVGQQLSSVGAGLTRSLTVPILAISGVAVKSFGDFDDAMNTSMAIMGNLSDTMKGELSNAAREVAKTTTFSASESAKAYYFLASAGLSAQQSLAALPKVAAFAQAGDFDLEKATSLLANSQSVLGLRVKDSAKNMENLVRVSDVLIKANILADATTEQFALSLTTKSGAAMRQLNIDVEEGVAVLAAWADQGVKGELAGERFSIVVRDLQTKAIKNADAFRRWGVEVYDSSGKFRPLADIIQTLEHALGGYSDKAQKAILLQLGFSDRSVDATRSLIGLSDKVREYEKDLRRAGGVTEDVQEKQLQSFEKQIDLIKHQITDTAITLGSSLVPAIKDFANQIIIPTIEKLNRLVKAFDALPEPTRKIIVEIAGLTAVVGPVVYIFGSLIKTLGALVEFAPTAVIAIKTIAGAFGGLPIIIAAVGLALNDMVSNWKHQMDEVIFKMTRFQEEAGKYLDTSAQLRRDIKLGSVSVEHLQAAGEEIGTISRDIKTLTESIPAMKKKAEEQFNYWEKKGYEEEVIRIQSEIKLQQARLDLMKQLVEKTKSLPHPSAVPEAIPKVPPLKNPDIPLGKTKAEKDLLEGLESVLRRIESAREALSIKSHEELSDIERLTAARLRGVDAYENEKREIEGEKKERELLAPLTKIEEEIKAKLVETVGKLSEKYGKNSDKVKEAKADAKGEIALIDATIESVKKHALQISIDTALMIDWAEWQKRSAEAAHAWAEQVTKDFKIAWEAKNELNNKLQEAFKLATINAPTIHIQNIETGYLEFLRSLHGKTEQETERLFANLAKIEGISVEQLTAEIKGLLGSLDDARTLQSIKGASKTPYDIYREERDNIVRVMQVTTNDVSLTVEQREQITRDGNAALLALDEQRWSSVLSDASGALDFLAQHFGNFFAQLKNLVNGIQQAQGFGKNVSGLVSSFGGSGQAAGAAGGVATVVGIFAVVYDFVDKMIKAHNALKMGTLSSLQVAGGDWSDPSYFNETGRKFDVALRNTIQSILDSIHGVLADLPQITVKARADGKKFAAYVAGVFVGEFDSAQEAMEQAIASALSGATFTNLSAEMKRILEVSIGKTLTELEANIAVANEAIADRLGDLGNAFVVNIDKYLQRIEAERKLGLSTEATTQAMMRSIAAYTNQILGIDTTASDRLAALHSLDLGMQEASGSIQSELQRRIDDVLAQIAAIENQAKHPGLGSGNSGGGGGQSSGGYNELGGGPLPVEDEALRHLREVLRQYTDELNKIPKALTDQQINMGIFDTLYQYLQKSPKYAEEAAKWARVKVEIEFAQIKLQLELLGKWEEFAGMFNDAYNAALEAAGKTPHSGSKSGDKQSVQSFIDDRKFQLALAGMDQYHQQLAQIAKDYEAQLKAAGKDKKLREELLALQQQETAAATKAHQKDIADRFIQLINPSDAFSQATKPFEDMKKEIEGAGYGADRAARMLSRLAVAEQEAIEKLSRVHFAGLLGDLSNIITDSKTNAAQHLLHNELLRTQEVINYQIKMIELRDEYVLLKAKGKLTKDEIGILDKAFGWIDKNANVLPGGKDWTPSFEQVTTAADSLSSAAKNQNEAANELKTAIQSLTDYQTSLHTDSSLGLVNSREALDNSKALYDSIAAKALGGDVNAIKEFKDDAETYRKNLLAFSPSSALTSSVVQGIDATINQIKALPSVQMALSSGDQAIVTNLGYVASGIASVDTIAQAINDNQLQTNQVLVTTAPGAIADAMNNSMLSASDNIAQAQDKNTQAVRDLSEQFKGLSSNVLAFRTESRNNSDELFDQFKRAADTLEVVAANTRPRHKKAEVGG